MINCHRLSVICQGYVRTDRCVHHCIIAKLETEIPKQTGLCVNIKLPLDYIHAYAIASRTTNMQIIFIYVRVKKWLSSISAVMMGISTGIP